MTPYTHADIVESINGRWSINLFHPATQMDSWIAGTFPTSVEAKLYLDKQHPEIEHVKYSRIHRHLTVERSEPAAPNSLKAIETLNFIDLLKEANVVFPLDHTGNFKGRHHLTWDEEANRVVLSIWVPAGKNWKIKSIKLQDKHVHMSATNLLKTIKEAIDLVE